jgi:hypothetical protein
VERRAFGDFSARSDLVGDGGLDERRSGEGAAVFTLADLRSWVYVAKFRSIKVGVTRGWSFGQKAPMGSKEVVEKVQANLGLKLYAALFGGSCVSLGSVCNWLVMMPDESATAIPRRISRFDYCQHHTCAQVQEVPDEATLSQYLFHISRADGSKNVASSERLKDGRIMHLRANAMIAVARDGRFGLEWGTALKRTFVKQFLGVFCVLTLHCLSERTTLEKLSYLSAIESQNLPAPGMVAGRTMSDKDKARRRLLGLATMLVRYRSSMASDDCGGRSEFRLYFMVSSSCLLLAWVSSCCFSQELRSVFGIAGLKIELREELQDTLAIVESDWMEEKRNEKNSELLWKLKKDALSKRKEEILAWQKRVFDVIYSAFSALGLPFIIIANIWSMNNSDLPREVSWAYLMLGCGLVSVVLFFLIYITFNRGRPELKSLREEEQALNSIRLEKFTDVVSDEAEQVQPAQVAPAPGQQHRRRFRFRVPEWLHLRSSSRLKAELAPLAAGAATNARPEENVELDEYLTRLEAGSEPGMEEDRPFEGPNYLEPSYHRDFSIDIQRPLPHGVAPSLTASRPKQKKGWLSWFKPGVSQTASSVPLPTVRDGFGDLSDEPHNDDCMERPRERFSLDLPRNAGARTASVPPARVSLDLAGSGRFSLDRERDLNDRQGLNFLFVCFVLLNGKKMMKCFLLADFLWTFREAKNETYIHRITTAFLT